MGVIMMKKYYSKTFYHRDEITDFLNYNECELVNITWLGSFWVVFYALSH